MPILTHKQSGLAPIAIIIAVVLVAAAAGGYFLLNKGGGAIPGLPGGIGLNPNCKYNDPDLCKFINNFKITNSYAAKSTTTDNSGAKTESNFESVGSDKTHIVFSEAGKETFNVITIGDTTYTKDFSDNKWWKQVKPKASKQPETQATNIKDEITKTEAPEDKTTYKKVGMEACGSRQCFKYEVIDPTITDSTDFLWFDNSEYLLRRERNESKDGSATDTEMNYTGVSINAPTPTKDATPDQIILPTGGTAPGMTEQEKQDLQKATEEMKKASQQAPAAAPAVPETPPADTTPPDTSGDNNP